MTRDEAADRMSLKVDQLNKLAGIRKAALPEIRAAIEDGRIRTVGAAYYIVTPNSDEKHDGVTSEDKQRQWLKDPRNINKPRQPKPPKRSIPFTNSQLKALSDLEARVVIEKLTPQANRNLKLEGKKLAIVDL